jgi:putative endonuclease
MLTETTGKMPVIRNSCTGKMPVLRKNFFMSFFDFWQSLFRRQPRSLGQRGEDAAAAFLLELGYRLVHRNYDIAGGEIDIVAVSPERTLVFVEVKTRENETLVRPEEAVDRLKQEQLFRIAAAYIKRYHLYNETVRYDIVGVIWPEGEKHPLVRHWPGALRME